MLSKIKNRKITSIEDLSPEEQKAVLESMDNLPCYPYSLRFLRDNYGSALDIDFSQVKEADLEKVHILTPAQVRILLSHDKEGLRDLCLFMNVKRIYAKAHEAFALDHDQMDMSLDAFRARCESEYIEQSSCEEEEKCQNHHQA